MFVSNWSCIIQTRLKIHRNKIKELEEEYINMPNKNLEQVYIGLKAEETMCNNLPDYVSLFAGFIVGFFTSLISISSKTTTINDIQSIFIVLGMSFIIIVGILQYKAFKGNIDEVMLRLGIVQQIIDKRRNEQTHCNQGDNQGNGSP